MTIVTDDNKEKLREQEDSVNKILEILTKERKGFQGG